VQQQGDESVREILVGIARRLPRYAQLVARLAADTRMSAAQRQPLVGVLGRGLPVIDLLPGLVPMLGRFDGLLGMFATVSMALHHVQPEVAEEHLAAVGLSREQVEADLQETTRLARRLAESGAPGALLPEGGARSAGRLVGRGLRAFRAAQQSTQGTQSTQSARGALPRPPEPPAQSS